MKILLQSRLSSARLPAKALLPIRGIPSAILAAKRAGNHGGRVCAITSVDDSDDVLAATFADHGIAVHRGELDDVLARTVGAVSELADGDIAVRLTGDNPFPDQDLIEAAASRLVERDLDYVGVRWPDDDLPYGLSVEAFRVGALRRAAEDTALAFDREHTTPWLRRHCRCDSLPGLAAANLARLRCTIDTFDDYLAMIRVFARIPDPVAAPWRDLVAILAAAADAPAGLAPALAYWGIPGDGPEAARISRVVVDAGATVARLGSRAVAAIRKSVECGVTHLLVSTDAPDANQMVGRALARQWSGRVAVVARLDVAPSSSADRVEAAVFRTCRDLGVSTLDVLLVPAGMDATGRATVAALRDWGAVRRIGLWGGGADPYEGIAAMVMGRAPAAEGIAVLGGADHRVIALDDGDIWGCLRAAMGNQTFG